jgi:hypothetical protein
MQLKKKVQTPTRYSIRYLDVGSFRALKEWETTADISGVLSSLEVFKCNRGNTGRKEFEELISKCRFPSLKVLSIRIEGNNRFPIEAAKNYDNLTCYFLEYLPPLTALCIRGTLTRSAYDAILAHHGNSLKSLSIQQKFHIERIIFNQLELQNLKNSCPNLEELELQVPRSRGDSDEIAMYRTLGSFPYLQCLALYLDASNLAIGWRVDDDSVSDYGDAPNDPSFDSFDQLFYPLVLDNLRKPRNGHVRDCFINQAVDEALAQSIFAVIAAGKSRDALKLQTLELESGGGGTFGARTRMGD